MANLDSLFSEYKPSGLVGGMFSGMNQGADLSSRFANTANTEQDVLKKQQMLPIELAQADAALDRDVMANDLTRATQSPEYLQQVGSNAVQEQKLKGMTIEQAAKLLPFDTFNKLMVHQSTNQAQMLSSMADAIDAGQIDSVYQQIKGMTQDKNALMSLDQEYAKAKANPKQASQQLRQRVFQISSGINEANGPMQQQRWLELLKSMTSMDIAKLSASSRGQTQDTSMNHWEAIEKWQNTVNALEQKLSAAKTNEERSKISFELARARTMLNRFTSETKSTALPGIMFKEQKDRGEQSDQSSPKVTLPSGATLR